MYLVQTTHLEVIEQKFLVSGQSYMEVDSMYSAIEAAKKQVPVYSIQDWITIFKLARSNRLRSINGPYHVKEITFPDFFDLKVLADLLIKNRTKDENKEKVNWLEVKNFRFRKDNPGRMEYKYHHSDSYKTISVYSHGRPQNLPITLPALYKRTLPISMQKKKDLLKLCRQGVIPATFRPWYEKLPTSNTAQDFLPPEEEEEEDESGEEFLQN
ncbi:hypothetical protein GE061_013106 [Apolygus lucorum]|uniref:Uncharacterized protein n=1 Tax=Apolygus lucorum TaxID=248454 RepID=A0A8S9XW84_APOLU|nr:hypothetical protein GE061_013106 [Apolygus lucorum]